jgi:hypothetical protein
MGQLKKDEQLGMKFGTACHKLRSQILFSLVQKTSQNNCFRCGKPIESVEEFSIDHKVDWLDSSPTLFWDLDNIAFSHKRCNIPRESKSKKLIIDGMAWCAQHKQYLPIENFYKDAGRWNGVNWRCKECQYKAKDNDVHRKKHREQEKINRRKRQAHTKFES